MLSGEGGKLRAIADIGTHWLDLVQFITGLSVSAVQADLKTVHTTRQRPTGEVETFSAKVQAPRPPSRSPSRPRTAAPRFSAFPVAPTARCGFRK